jgi:hypothetical protein
MQVCRQETVEKAAQLSFFGGNTCDEVDRRFLVVEIGGWKIAP